jgi:hypothetical protein
LFCLYRYTSYTRIDLNSGHIASDIASGAQGIHGSIFVSDIPLHLDISSGAQGIHGSILVKDVSLHSDIASGAQGISGSILISGHTAPRGHCLRCTRYTRYIFVPDVAARYAALLGHIILIPNQQISVFLLLNAAVS